jgi:hypothetical protein
MDLMAQRKTFAVLYTGKKYHVLKYLSNGDNAVSETSFGLYHHQVVLYIIMSS